jgi:hypothetical protein
VGIFVTREEAILSVEYAFTTRTQTAKKEVPATLAKI